MEAPQTLPEIVERLAQGLFSHQGNAALRAQLEREEFTPSALLSELSRFALNLSILAYAHRVDPRPEALQSWPGCEAYFSDPACPLAGLGFECDLDEDSFRWVVGGLEQLSPRPEAMVMAFEGLMGWQLVLRGGGLSLVSTAGSGRKTSGSYYTPKILIDALLDRCLEPLLEQAQRAPDPCAALRRLRICDPACGAGNFLRQVALRIGQRYASWAGLPLSQAIAELAPLCVFGVDLQPIAVDMCRFQLWSLMDAPLKDLELLRPAIRVGDALWGTTSEALQGEPQRSRPNTRDAGQMELFGAPEAGLPSRERADQWCADAVPMASHGRPCFHWQWEFPEVFSTGGFDAVVGNPPWERVKLQEREWFAARIPAIAKARRAATRQALIEELKEQRPAAYEAYEEARSQAEALSHFLRHSGLFPLSGRGDVNLYTAFVELSRRLIHDRGRVALWVPSGIATDKTTRHFFRELMESQTLKGLYDFENKERYFPQVSSRMRFCLLLLQGPGLPVEQPPEFLFFAHRPEDIESQERCFSLSSEELELLNPNTETCPIFRSKRDAELTLSMYRRWPVLHHEAMPEASAGSVPRFLRMFDMTNHSKAFHNAEELKAKGATLSSGRWHLDDEWYEPLYEGKMFDQFDHRLAHVRVRDNVSRPGQPELLSLEEHRDPELLATPQYWVRRSAVQKALRGREHRWFLAFKDVTSPTNSRTCIAAILPYAAVSNSAPLLFFEPFEAADAARMCAALNSFALDYLARQKISSLHLNFFIVKQLPFVPKERFEQPCPWEPEASLGEWICRKVLELSYTAEDLRLFAEDLGYSGAPFAWDPERRRELRCQLDAAIFWLYGYEIPEIEYVMETFPIIKKREEKALGRYQSKLEVLEYLEAWGLVGLA